MHRARTSNWYRYNVFLAAVQTIGLHIVILEAPVGQSSDVWALVEPLIAKKTKVGKVVT